MTMAKKSASPRVIATTIAACVIVAALATMAAVPAQAADRPAKPVVLTVMGGNAIVGITDSGEKGPTPGDMRTLSLTLSTTKSVPLGHVDVVQILTRQQGNVGTAVKTVEMTLPKGTISIMGVVEFADITNPGSRPNDGTEHLAIVGGTGAYRGTTGEVEITILPEFTSRWTLTIYRG